jgi:hypothetical protein
MGSLSLFQASMRGWLMSTTTTCGKEPEPSRGAEGPSARPKHAAGTRARAHLDVRAANSAAARRVSTVARAARLPECIGLGN